MEKSVVQNEEDQKEYAAEYDSILGNSTGPVIIRTEWLTKGDALKQVSIYNQNYAPVKTLDNTSFVPGCTILIQ